MVSATTVRALQSSMSRLNKQVATNASRGNMRQFTGYMLGMTALFGTGAYLMYEYYYKDNKMSKIFQQERTKYGASARHGL